MRPVFDAVGVVDVDVAFDDAVDVGVVDAVGVVDDVVDVGILVAGVSSLLLSLSLVVVVVVVFSC